MYLFLHIQDTQNTSLLIKRGYYLNTTIEKLWYKLQDERIGNNKYSDDYFRLFDLKFKYVKKVSKYLQNPNRFLEQELDIIEVQIKNLQDKGENSVSFDEIYGWLVSEMGVISLQTISVREFDSILNYAVKIAEKRKANGK